MYSEKVMELFKNPKNMGAILNANAVGEVGNPICGDIMKIYLKVKDDVITDIGFETLGCAAAIANSSMVTELAKNKTLEDARAITFEQIEQELGGLPPAKVHCAKLAIKALNKAIDNYKEKNS